jgi:PAS domain S-box-containing protein
MSEATLQSACLHDARLAPLAVSAQPVWLWSMDATRVLWTNATGAAIFGEPSCTAVTLRRFDAGELSAEQILQLAATLPADGQAQLHRLRDFGAGIDGALACTCARIALADGTLGVLVIATEHAGPELPFNKRLQRLLAGCDEALAAFSPDGNLLDATPAAQAHLAGATTLAALGVTALAREGLLSGHSEGATAAGSVAFDRIGPMPILIATFAPPRVTEQPETLAFPIESLPPAGSPIEAPPPAPIVAQPVATEAAASELHEAGESEPPPAAQEEPAPITAQPAPISIGEPAALAAAVAPVTPPAAPVASERRHPLRFVWEMDQDCRFTLACEEFIALAGPRTAALLGERWAEIASVLRLDSENRVAQAIATQDTWSGITVAWPADDGAEPLPVELSGLPIFDRERSFRGYRGFGVCRDVARLAALQEARRAAPAAETADAPPAAPAVSMEQPTGALAGENVVPFRAPAGESHGPALSPLERSAFHELSRKLAQRLTGIEPTDQTAIESAAAAHDADGGMPHEPAPSDAALSDEEAEADAEQAAGQEAAASDQAPREPEATLAMQSAVTARNAQPMFDKLPIGVLIYRLDQLLYANPAFLRWSGHDSLEALTAAGSLDSLFVEPSVVVVAAGAPLPLTIDRGDNVLIEAELIAIHWEGEPAHALVTSAPPGASKPAPTQLDGMRAEVAELQSILDAAADGVIMLDRVGRILSANSGAAALFGEEQLAGRSFLDLLMPESVDIASEYFESVVHDGLAGDGGREVTGCRRQGGPIPLLVILASTGADTGRLCAVFRDITRWKQAEDKLLSAKRRAQKDSSAKSDFIAKISHEIRTPLNAIIGFSEVMMQERFGPIGNERYRDYLKDIHTSGGHLMSLIDDLLDLSKIEAGKLDLTFTSVGLNDLAQQCVAIMQPQASRGRVIIRTSLPPALPQVMADARSVRQIVLNLLSNSIKFTGAGGQVIVSTALNDNGEVVLRVRDTGIGMSEKDLSAALEPFRQLAVASARSGAGGTGLGLPLTKALAEANRARFQIRSTPKEGTLVEVAFPAAQAAE